MSVEIVLSHIGIIKNIVPLVAARMQLIKE
jgi:hypothetical protein